MTTRAQDLARQIAAFDPAQLDRKPQEKARLCLFDFLGCAMESIGLPPSQQALAVASATPGAHIVGSAQTSTATDAAFANAVMGHGLVREDMHAGSIAHHGVVVWPALLALAELRRVPGHRLLAAAVLAYEVGCRLGRMLVDGEVARLFRPTGLVGAIGSAAGGAWLLGLDETQTASAIAIAANTSSGLDQWPKTGGSDMYFHPGFAARNAVTAVQLAEAGAFGTPDILEGRSGLFAGFARRAMPGPVVLFPEGAADILNVYHKAAPACNFAQTACQAALKIAEELGPEAASVEAVRVIVPEAAARYPGCDGVGPFERTLQAKMSIPYGVASVLAYGRLAEANYADLANPEVRRLIAACRLETDEALTRAFPAQQGAKIQVALAGGRRLSAGLPDVVPATEVEVRERFRQVAERVLGATRVEAIEAFLDTIETQGDAGRIAALCARTEAPRVRRRPKQKGGTADQEIAGAV